LKNIEKKKLPYGNYLKYDNNKLKKILQGKVVNMVNSIFYVPVVLLVLSMTALFYCWMSGDVEDGKIILQNIEKIEQEMIK